MELVSVIITYYKKKKYFEKCFNTVISQTYPNIEIIIVYDDISKKELNFIEKVIKKKKKPGIESKIINNNKNYGAAVSRNIGIKNSNGKYLAFLDGDDFWDKSKIQKQIKFMKLNNCSFSYTSYALVDNSGKKYSFWNAKKQIKLKDLKYTCDIGLSSVIVKKEILNLLKFPNLKTKEDYALWSLLAKKKVKMLGVDQILTYWRNTPNSLSKSITQKISDAFRFYFFYDKRSLIYSIVSVVIMCLFFIRKYLEVKFRKF